MAAIGRLVRKFVRRQLAKRGKEIVSATAKNGPPLPVFRVLIEHCATRHGKGAILQIGANDGLMDDPIHQSIVSLRLPALLVEPLPDIFERLKANYRGMPNVRFENAAISTMTVEADIYRINPASRDFPSWVHGLASFDKQVLLKHANLEGVRGKDFQGQIQTIRVPVLTVEQLLQRHRDIGPLLALQVDTEGHDFRVIQSAVQAGCLPPIIHFEHRHLTLQDQEACQELLTAHGYTFLTMKDDTLAYRCDASPIP